MTTVTEELLTEIKNELDITWSDEDINSKITNIILRGTSFLDKKAGAILDYSANDRPKEVLIEYCRAVHNHVLNEFMVNYAPFIIDLRIGGGGTSGE